MYTELSSQSQETQNNEIFTEKKSFIFNRMMKHTALWTLNSYKVSLNLLNFE